MNNSSLNNAAKELQSHLVPKVGCYCVVGWQKSTDDGSVITVYVDKRKSIPDNVIPAIWRGFPVTLHKILPPGTVSSDKESAN